MARKSAISAWRGTAATSGAPRRGEGLRTALRRWPGRSSKAEESRRAGVLMRGSGRVAARATRSATVEVVSLYKNI
ncbi:hypothetical protein Maq22A_c26010 [Methylobacterium aquaticum]|uniref:Uncharacterized protein n=1 Tax=Methylobacterium aquaticum TaxID=270351 RepID=A0A0C6FXL7_9HYPH|nr:hypothetical protein Maq22A_c26010 [Methylobacterium aquaticum]